MIAKLKPYPVMKNSGVPWLGEVPKHWEVQRLKQICHLVYGDALATDVREHGTVPVYGSNGRVGFHSSANSKAPCIIIGRKGSFGKVNFSTEPVFAIDTTFFIDDRFSAGDLRWLFYLLGWLRLDGVSKDSAVPGLDREDAYQRVATFPPLPEQTAIVRFLDHYDRKIRRYIRAKQKLIERLEEQKQAVIHRAVTRGLDPNVRLKPSGVEWLGDMPEHWEVVRNGRLFFQRNETGFPELPILEVSLKTGVRIRDFEDSARKQVMTDRSKYKRAAKGDIAYNMMRMWQGAVGVTPVDGLVSPAYVVARPLGGVEPRYFNALFRTSAYMGEVDKFSRGIVKDRNRLYWEDFKQMSTPCPPPDERKYSVNPVPQGGFFVKIRSITRPVWPRMDVLCESNHKTPEIGLINRADSSKRPYFDRIPTWFTECLRPDDYRHQRTRSRTADLHGPDRLTLRSWGWIDRRGARATGRLWHRLDLRRCPGLRP